jgi:hypothetical protein
MNKRNKAKTNPGKRHQRHKWRVKVKEPILLHFSVPVPQFCLVACRYNPSLLCRNRGKTLRGYCDTRTGVLNRTKAWKFNELEKNQALGGHADRASACAAKA